MYASRVLGGLFSGAVTSVIVAYVADITPPEQRTKGMGLVGMSIGLGFTIGPGVGGLLSLVSAIRRFLQRQRLRLITFLLAVTKLTESLTADKRQTMQASGSRPAGALLPVGQIFVRAGAVRIAVACRLGGDTSAVRHEAL